MNKEKAKKRQQKNDELCKQFKKAKSDLERVQILKKLLNKKAKKVYNKLDIEEQKALAEDLDMFDWVDYKGIQWMLLYDIRETMKIVSSIVGYITPFSKKVLTTTDIIEVYKGI